MSALEESGVINDMKTMILDVMCMTFDKDRTR